MMHIYSSVKDSIGQEKITAGWIKTAQANMPSKSLCKPRLQFSDLDEKIQENQ